MKFNWEEFLSNDKIAVHCRTEEQAIDFCRQMHEHGLTWNSGESYLKFTEWNVYKEKTVYEGDGAFANLEYYTKNNCTILEWSDYEKENNMNLELGNLTDEQKEQIIELAKKFEQENEVDKLDFNNDWKVYSNNGKVEETCKRSIGIDTDLFSLGLTAHTKEEAEKIRRRLLVEKELRDLAKKCKEPVCFGNGSIKYSVCYNERNKAVFAESFRNFAAGNIIFTDESILKKAIESIGQERLIIDYFGIDN